MRADYVFHILNDRVNQLAELAAACPEDKRNFVPDGFNNSIHWNLGHVLISTELHLFFLSDNEQDIVLPMEYPSYFGYGTKPADWLDEPPAWDALIAQLKAHPEQIRERIGSKLDMPVKENFFKAETFGELIVATSLHIAQHAGVVTAMLKALK